MPTKIKEVPTKEFLEDWFYEKDGFIYWKPRKISKNRDSQRAHLRINTYLDECGYYRCCIRRQTYPLSRIIYQIHHGDLTPDYEVDHIDGCKTNNLIENLRAVPQEVNKRNKPRPKNAGSDTTGVCLNRKKWEGGILEYWVARWYDAEGVLRGKHFRIDEHGSDEAFRLASEYRKQMIDKRNEEGAGYSDRHGT